MTNKYSRGTTCGEVAKFTVRGVPLCRKHAADRVFDNAITIDDAEDAFGLVAL